MLCLKTHTKWHVGKRIDEPRLSASMSIWYYHSSQLSDTAPKSISGFATAHSWAFKQAAHRPQSHRFFSSSSSSFLLCEGAPARLCCRNPLCNTRHAHNCFLSLLGEREALCQPQSQVFMHLEPCYSPYGDTRSWHRGGKGQLHTSPKLQVQAARGSKGLLQKGEMARTVIPLSNNFSLINSVSSQQLQSGF